MADRRFVVELLRRPTFLRLPAAHHSIGRVSRRRRAPRRLLIRIGCSSFLSQFWSMAANIIGSNSNSFIASARQQRSAIAEVLENVNWPEQFPFKEEDFQRFDESPDSVFYDYPRFVTHIDDAAIAALTRYYSHVLPRSNTPGVALLDIHYPKGYRQGRIVGMGMNAEELKRNPVRPSFRVLTEYIVQDLNVDPKLPFDDGTFDAITNVVSVDYLTKPIEVFREMGRVLKPGGLAVMSFSNRCFFTKAISVWTSTGDAEHVMIVGAYFHYAGGYEPPKAVDISPEPGRTDPMYVVYSRKKVSSPDP
ncbi:hypothetical protein M569_08173 [Genlisea aurea]|uniref:Methyltransferase type 11 domain-containing protein n=1 Tax=Genlisea aurea TaxID=192259 RepID=S8E2U5_9LAMI|nr:hypothetical protein M569_08173 [Genlisea aurea]